MNIGNTLVGIFGAVLRTYNAGRWERFWEREQGSGDLGDAFWKCWRRERFFKEMMRGLVENAQQINIV